ncbi:MAG: phenylalanine--tRNA ligase subunit alpha [candidate division WOR-3 bacterium]|uniref:Phenylalanine--tRNA ligase alpha subunit n=1 Tax=candidate division WOR-3 bacterium TaxID=2052148 RepID=A0A7V3ZTD4_UNCW3
MDLKELKIALEEEIKSCKSFEDLEKLRTKYLGRKGLLKEYFKKLKNFPEEERKEAGKILNEIQEKIKKFIEEKSKEFPKEEEFIDLFLPVRKLLTGSLHPISITLKEIEEIFANMGFEVVSGPEIESEYNNFEALNIPKEHPVRDMQASFFIEEDIILRTHTSPVQIRVMSSRKPPVRIIAPGKVYRVDPFDPSHSPVFHQVEGLYVDEGVTFAELKGTIEIFAREFFGPDTRIKFLPSYFPFTEPSAEVAISCTICKGKGCSTCGGEGWLEILGCGMVHPKVFENVGYDPERYTGYAFGFGVERMAMIKYRIPDIRLFYENSIDFLEIFK